METRNIKIPVEIKDTDIVSSLYKLLSKIKGFDMSGDVDISIHEDKIQVSHKDKKIVDKMCRELYEYFKGRTKT